MKNQKRSRKPANANGVGSSAVLCRPLTEIMADISKDGWCVVIKCLPDGFPWLTGENGKNLVVAKWAAEASWAQPSTTYRHPEHAAAETPEKALNELMAKIAAQPRRHNAGAEPRAGEQ